MKSILQNKKTIAVIRVAALVVLFAALFFMWKYNSGKTNIEVMQANINAQVESEPEATPDGSALPSEGDGADENLIDFTKVQYMTTDFTELLAQNSDTVGWVRVNGTKVNYPVVQVPDNDFYLNHSFDKSEKRAGWVFGDFRNDFETLGRNTILYGHDMADNTMFGSLAFCLDEWWYKNSDNHIIRFNTLYDQTVWQIFSVYVIPVENYYIKTSFSDDADYMKFLKAMKNRNQIDALGDVSLTPDDRIFTLSTCRGPEKRLVVTAKLVKTTHIKIP